MNRAALVSVAMVVGLTFGASAAGAGQGAVQVRGVQTPAATCNGTTGALGDAYVMTGGFNGCWYTDDIDFAGVRSHPSGTTQLSGHEHFDGCIDLNGNGSCDGDEPAGSLFFAFTFTAKYSTTTGAEIHGRCHHKVTSGTEDFTGASGVVSFHDDVVNVVFPYHGEIKLAAGNGNGHGKGKASKTASAASSTSASAAAFSSAVAAASGTGGGC